RVDVACSIALTNTPARAKASCNGFPRIAASSGAHADTSRVRVAIGPVLTNLFAASISVAPDPVNAGDSVTIGIRIRNTTHVDAPAAHFRIRLLDASNLQPPYDTVFVEPLVQHDAPF